MPLDAMVDGVDGLDLIIDHWTYSTFGFCLCFIAEKMQPNNGFTENL